ncbi:hypothetical protein CDL12_07994 [Handroanthus impetiginosus]|uniref:Uncharacterized protein n=1 Tax=Handroanthus impetiginosus TaxID=429701 RepID=A0A2G9HP84_9LAMI|nr:hypothetical protein CDL12_07994 [Handroanthus impetiginosus]
MIPQQWTPPCNSQCTHKYAALMQIPFRHLVRLQFDIPPEKINQVHSRPPKPPPEEKPPPPADESRPPLISDDEMPSTSA